MSSADNQQSNGKAEIKAKIFKRFVTATAAEHQDQWLALISQSSFEGIQFRSDTNRTGADGLSFYYPRLLHCLNQMLAVVLLSQHRVSSSKTVRPRAPCGARCIGHAVSTWSAVYSEAPHSQFGEGARFHLCMDEWNRPTPVRRRLSLTQAARGKLIPTSLALLEMRNTPRQDIQVSPAQILFGQATRSVIPICSPKYSNRDHARR